MPSLRAVDSPDAPDLEKAAREAAMREVDAVLTDYQTVVERAGAAFRLILAEPWAREVLRKLEAQGRMLVRDIEEGRTQRGRRP